MTYEENYYIHGKKGKDTHSNRVARDNLASISCGVKYEGTMCAGHNFIRIVKILLPMVSPGTQSSRERTHQR